MREISPFALLVAIATQSEQLATDFPRRENTQTHRKGIGFMIDESLGLQHFPSDAYSEDVKEVDAQYKPYLDGGYFVGGQVWPVLSLAKLAADPDLEQLAIDA